MRSPCCNQEKRQVHDTVNLYSDLLTLPVNGLFIKQFSTFQYLVDCLGLSDAVRLVQLRSGRTIRFTTACRLLGIDVVNHRECLYRFAVPTVSSLVKTLEVSNVLNNLEKLDLITLSERHNISTRTISRYKKLYARYIPSEVINNG